MTALHCETIWNCQPMRTDSNAPSWVQGWNRPENLTLYKICAVISACNHVAIDWLDWMCNSRLAFTLTSHYYCYVSNLVKGHWCNSAHSGLCNVGIRFQLYQQCFMTVDILHHKGLWMHCNSLWMCPNRRGIHRKCYWFSFSLDMCRWEKHIIHLFLYE